METDKERPRLNLAERVLCLPPKVWRSEIPDVHAFQTSGNPRACGCNDGNRWDLTTFLAFFSLGTGIVWNLKGRMQVEKRRH